MLAIKGPVLQEHGLRARHASIDVDVLVEPRQHEALVTALMEVGWASLVESTTATIGGTHSKPLVHVSWPVEIDVHHRFPGFLAEPEVVFETLWESRSSMRLAGAEVTCTDRAASAAVAALHCLRRPDRSAGQLDDLCRRVAASFDESERERLRHLANATGSSASLRHFLARVDVVVDDRSVGVVWDEWQLLTRSGGQHTVAWMHELARTPWRRRPALLRRALLLSEPEIRHLYSDLPAGRRGLLLGRFRRLRVGLKSLPRAARTLRHTRRESASRGLEPRDRDRSAG